MAKVEVPIAIDPAKLSEVRRLVRDLEARLHASQFVCAERERELLELKGPCSFTACRLHYAHAGPCDLRTPPPAAAAELRARDCTCPMVDVTQLDAQPKFDPGLDPKCPIHGIVSGGRP